MKTFYYFILLIILFSCKVESELPSPPSTLVELQYPTGTGNSSNEVNGLLGYGYDANGFCDTISARAKILDLTDNSNDIFMGHPRSFTPTLFSGGDFADFSEKINNVNITNCSGFALTSHIKSLFKLAFNSDSINPNDAFAYYAETYYDSRYKLYVLSNELKTTSSFNNDVFSLSPGQLISKYGTHVLTDVSLGSRIEVLYRCIPDVNGSAQSAEQGIYKRMNQFLNGIPGIISINQTPVHTAKDEQLIYNTIGSKIKLCGLINATDNNPDNIQVNLSSAFGENIKVQFIQIGEDGILPLYDLIKDLTKKQEIKDYIEEYMNSISSTK